MKRRGAVLLFAVVAAVGLCLGPAGAASRHRGDVLVVDDDADPGSCRGRHADFDTIQAAINDSDTEAGDTILVCPGTYDETVKATKASLTIKGAAAGHDARRRGRRRESIVTSIHAKGTVQLLEDDIRWDGFTIRGVANQVNGPGMYTSPAHSGYDIRDTIFEDNGIGLHLGSRGAHTTIVCRNRFIANNEFEGPGGANGIYSNEGARDVSILSNQFEGHNGAGIFFADSRTGIRQRDIRVGWNRSVDDKTFATFFATSRLRLHRNLVRARLFDPIPALHAKVSAIFIGASNDDVVVHRNRVQAASGNGIDVTDTGQLGPRHPPTWPCSRTGSSTPSCWASACPPRASETTRSAATGRSTTPRSASIWGRAPTTSSSSATRPSATASTARTRAPATVPPGPTTAGGGTWATAPALRASAPRPPGPSRPRTTAAAVTASPGSTAIRASAPPWRF